MSAFGINLTADYGQDYRVAVDHARAGRIALPTFAEMANPATIVPELMEGLSRVSPHDPAPENLFRIHWFNEFDAGGIGSQPRHVELPPALTGVDSRIVVILGDAFPMIAAHKVLAAYACLVTRLVTGRLNPNRHKAVWPSTGNYCRGGIAISRILKCRGIAVLPEHMSDERFAWLDQWVLRPDEDIVKTHGSESNVKEIYDKCDELGLDPDVVVLNQFTEFANYLAHRCVTGPSIEVLFNSLPASGEKRLAAFIAGTGSAGTLAAGDYLKEKLGTKIVATEPLECPTMLQNGYGEHNIQGIGDKHIPLIQNVMNMDFVIGVSDVNSDLLNVLFNSDQGRSYLWESGLAREVDLDALGHIGLSGLANIQSAIKLSKHLSLGRDDILVCIATDGAALYRSEMNNAIELRLKGSCQATDCAEIRGRALSGCEPAYVLELTSRERERIFNLGYYTWVEQRGVNVDDFDRRRDQGFWNAVAAQVGELDEKISRFNSDAGLRR